MITAEERLQSTLWAFSIKFYYCGSNHALHTIAHLLARTSAAFNSGPRIRIQYIKAYLIWPILERWYVGGDADGSDPLLCRPLCRRDPSEARTSDLKLHLERVPERDGFLSTRPPQLSPVG